MRQQKRRIKFLERKEIERLILSIKPRGYRGTRDRALMEVLFSTGMRIHEALAITVDEMRIVLDEEGTSEFPIIGKGGWQRVVYFSPKAKEAVKRYLPRRTTSDVGDDRLFAITPRCAQIMMVKRGEDVGLKIRLTPHVFRHSLATDLLGRGVDVRVVQEFLGHRSIANTMIYTHVSNKTLKDTHTKIYG